MIGIKLYQDHSLYKYSARNSKATETPAWNLHILRVSGNNVQGGGGSNWPLTAQ